MASLPFVSVLKPAGQFLQRLTHVAPKEPKLLLGVDIGSTAVKAIALGPRRGATRPIIAQQLVPLPQGQDTDAAGALKAAVAALKVPTRTVNLSVSGPWVIMRVVEMPALKPAEMKQALPFEAQRYLPFNVQDVVIDGVVLGPADANKSWVLIVACKKELLERRLDWVKRAGLEAALVDVDALALANSFLAQVNGRGAEERTRAVVNVGGQLTNLVVFKGTIPYLVRDIPWGGEKFLRTVADHLGKEAAAVSQELTQPEPSREVLDAMKPTAESLVAELQLSFDYFENRFGHPPDEVLVSGGVSLCPGFLDALKGHLTQNVSAWTPVRGLSGQFAVAYGLALRSS